MTVRGEKLRGRSRRPNIRGENAHHGSERARHDDLLARWNVRIRLFELHSRNRGYQHENARNCRARETGFSALPQHRRLSDGERVWLTLKDGCKTMVFAAKPPFQVLRVIDTGPITNHVNIVQHRPARSPMSRSAD